ncbi:transcription factor PIF1-like [Vicia villosa]|uniref:transcription factor PIF1-like n=1 Tax=Vicia villosa TaxID=3911 RepID=UPI00273C80FE|nr:transcription factor PIF1-like [Vicia villosa]
MDPRKPFIAGDDIMELQWQNGRVVTQNQNHRNVNQPQPVRNSDDSTRGGSTSLPRENQYLFMHEGEMASVQHYANATMQGPPMRSEPVPPNFAFFARQGVRAEPEPAEPEPAEPEPAESESEPAESESEPAESEPLTDTESLVDSSDSSSVMPMAVSETEGEESCLTAPSTMSEETDGWSDWSSDEEQPVLRRSDAQEWNHQRKRRRNEINEKMRVLQQLLPRSNNKSDEESMLDAAIQYTKSLQLQVQFMQMMSMRYGTVSMMFPAIQQYMRPPIGMGMNMPVMSFPNMFPSSTSSLNFGPRFSMPSVHMPRVSTPGSFIIPATNPANNNMSTSVGTYNSNHLGIPNFTDPYQQYMGAYQMQSQLMQNQAMNQTNVSKFESGRQSGDK